MNTDDNLNLLKHLRMYSFNEIENSLDINSKKIVKDVNDIVNQFQNDNIKRILLQFYCGTIISDRTFIYVIRHPNLDINLRNNIKFQINDIYQLIIILSLFEDELNNRDSELYKDFIDRNKQLLVTFNKKEVDDQEKIRKKCHINETTEECKIRKSKGLPYKTPEEIELENIKKYEEELLKEQQKNISDKIDNIREKEEEEEQEKILDNTKEEEKISDNTREEEKISGGQSKHIIMNDKQNRRYLLLNEKKYQILNNTDKELLVVDKNKFNRIQI
tara:strand:+ start:4264 stop:5088 length:825 start_codon:yes stop_codon:yes gene_type:complete